MSAYGVNSTIEQDVDGHFMPLQEEFWSSAGPLTMKPTQIV